MIDMRNIFRGLERMEQKARAAGVRAINQFAHAVLAQAQFLCPKETGALAASGKVEPPVINGDQVEQTLGFNTSYAAIVHERLVGPSGNPIYHAPPTQAKYLETPMRQMQPKLAPFVAEEVKKAMG